MPLHSVAWSAETASTQNGCSAAYAPTRLRVRNVSAITTRSGTVRDSDQTWCSPGAARITRPSCACTRSTSVSALSNCSITAIRSARETAGSASTRFFASASRLRSRTGS